MAIEIRGLSKAFGERVLFRGLTLTLPEGETSCLMAPSGYGKTTLLRILLGLEQPDEGEISGLAGKYLAPVFQEDRLCENLSAGANIRMVMPDPSRTTPARLLEELGLPGTLHTPVRRLSGGQRRRVALARALLADADILLLDEPFSGLDHETRAATAACICAYAAGKTILLVTHDEAEAALLQGRVVRIDAQGQ